MKTYNVTLGGTTLFVEAGDETEAIRLARLQVPDRCGSIQAVATEEATQVTEQKATEEATKEEVVARDTSDESQCNSLADVSLEQ